MGEKIRILVINHDNTGGVGHYRSIQPHVALEEMYKYKYEITFNSNPVWTNIPYFLSFDIIHVQRGLYEDMTAFRNTIQLMRDNGKVTILDLDDHWKLPHWHPLHSAALQHKFSEKIVENFKVFEFVTTTTPLFADAIRKFNKNVYVIPNAIDPSEDRYQIVKTPSDKLRGGMIMGASHKQDVAILGEIANKMPKSVMDKIQFVLCGFDLRGTKTELNKATGKVVTRNIRPEETVWTYYEKVLTDNYRSVSERYNKFLHMYMPDAQYPDVENEPYMRCWTKDMNHYFKHYENVDVLLAPLANNDFNRVKSQLKAIECCFSKTALIASNIGPYTIDLVSMFGKGGEYNENGNALLIDESKNHKLWVKYIAKLAENPDLVRKLSDNIHESLKDKYSMSAVIKVRDAAYTEMYEKKKIKTVKL